MPLRYTLTTGRSDMAGNGVSLYAYDFPVDTLSLNRARRDVSFSNTICGSRRSLASTTWASLRRLE